MGAILDSLFWHRDVCESYRRAKLVATWDDVGEELPTDVQEALSAMRQNESPERETASLSPDAVSSPHEKKILKLLKADESTRIDRLVESLEEEMSASEIFAALLELE
jgi:DNA processing protein